MKMERKRDSLRLKLSVRWDACVGHDIIDLVIHIFFIYSFRIHGHYVTEWNETLFINKAMVKNLDPMSHFEQRLGSTDLLS